MILVAFGPITQERWIVQHLPNLPASFAIGLGGTFDYIVGIRSAPPAFIRAIGLEWLYRLFTQPHRIKRIYQAVWGLILSLVRYKVFDTYPYRRNGVAIVVNKENKILLCKRAFAIFDKFTEDYWQFPQGGLEEQEREVEGTMRELKEETGMHSVEVLEAGIVIKVKSSKPCFFDLLDQNMRSIWISTS